jgi:hypothetical protein
MVRSQVLSSIAELFVPESKLEVDVEQVRALLLPFSLSACHGHGSLGASPDRAGSHQTVSDIDQALQRTSLTPDSRRALLGALTQCTSPTDAVHQLL